MNKEYLFKVGTKPVYGRVRSIDHRVDVNTMVNTDTLLLNEVGAVSVSLNGPVVFDAYKSSKGTGSFVVIDRMSNITIAAGMIESAIEKSENLTTLSYEERLQAFNAEVAALTRKYFPE